MSTPTLRRATPDDARPLAALGRSTFVDTFVHGFGIPYPAEDLEVFLATAYAEAAFRAAIADPAHAWWIAEAGGSPVAYAQAGPNTLPHPDARPGEVELKRLYVDAPAQGLGLGRTLLEAALAWMEARNAGPLWIGVWSGNHRA